MPDTVCAFCGGEVPADAEPCSIRFNWYRCAECERVYQRKEARKLKRTGTCALCDRTQVLVQDHDHSCCKTGNGCEKCRRGKICIPCNSGLGMLGDDIAGLERALTYLRAYAARRVET